MKTFMKTISKILQQLMIVRSLFYFCERNIKTNSPILPTQQSTYYVPVITTALSCDGKLQKLLRNWTDTWLLPPCVNSKGHRSSHEV